jgi:hypothetical protein
MKTCTKCSIEKPLLDFYSHPKTQDGKQSSCKACCIKTQKPHTQKYFKNHPEKFKGNSEITKQWRVNQKKISPLFKLRENISSLMCNSFKRACNGKHSKQSKTSEILGCTISEFITHLQSQFKPGMTLENHGQGVGKWNIDHIIPISSAKTEEEIYKLSHHSNLQPLWWEENMAKGAKKEWF